MAIKSGVPKHMPLCVCYKVKQPAVRQQLVHAMDCQTSTCYIM